MPRTSTPALQRKGQPARPKVKVRCSEVRVCGWSGERRNDGGFGPTHDPTDKPCPRCLRRSVERVGRTNPNRYL
jgi:hypothetical protein